MDNNFEEYLSSITQKKENAKTLTREDLVVGAAVNINRIKLELEQLKDAILHTKHIDEFDIFICGAQLEMAKRDIIKIKQEYLKKA